MKVTRFLRLFAFAALATASTFAANASAAIIFDDFNAGNGHFISAPHISSQSVGEVNTSTAGQVTTDGPREGAGHLKVALVHDGSATNLRIRLLSGGGTVANNTPFTTSGGTDGWIGFYAKTSANNAGWTIAMNLDGGAAGATADMDMGAAKTIIADGAWHLYEWNLDDDTQWNAVTSIGGNGTIENGQHSVDSLYIFANSTGTANQARDPLYIDFIAKSDSGSIARLLIPEPATLALAGMGLIGLCSIARRKNA